MIAVNNMASDDQVDQDEQDVKDEKKKEDKEYYDE